MRACMSESVSVCMHVCVCRVIRSSSTILKKAVGKIIWRRKCKTCFFFRFTTVSKLQLFMLMLFYYYDCQLLQNGNNLY
jgi:transcriptional regulator NrdR family protein